jgi:hypothetical protein
MKALKSVWGILGICVVVLMLGIQFVPVDRTNPPVQTQVPASADARAVLKRACYDCHSNETVWPWYSYVAPVSWLVAKDVADGRKELNFSTWNLMSAEEQREALGESWEKVLSGEMPMKIYLPMHPEAKLSPSDRSVLQTWAASGGSAEGGASGGASGATGSAAGDQDGDND